MQASFKLEIVIYKIIWAAAAIIFPTPADCYYCTLMRLGK